MRTTVDLPDDLHEIVRSIARDRSQTLSEAVVALMRRGMGGVTSGLEMVPHPEMVSRRFDWAARSPRTTSGPSRTSGTTLLDGNVLVALAVQDHVHHSAAHRWLGGTTVPSPRARGLAALHTDVAELLSTTAV